MRASDTIPGSTTLTLVLDWLKDETQLAGWDPVLSSMDREKTGRWLTTTLHSLTLIVTDRINLLKQALNLCPPQLWGDSWELALTWGHNGTTNLDTGAISSVKNYLSTLWPPSLDSVGTNGSQGTRPGDGTGASPPDIRDNALRGGDTFSLLDGQLSFLGEAETLGAPSFSMDGELRSMGSFKTPQGPLTGPPHLPTGDSLRDKTPTGSLTAHDRLGRAFKRWTLFADNTILILGDDNVALIPLCGLGTLQVDCFPGCTLGQAAYILEHNTPVSPLVLKVILSLGLSDRAQTNPSLMESNLKRLWRAARASFPNAQLHMPLVNYSPALPRREIRSLSLLNRLIRGTLEFIPRLPFFLFDTLRDQTSWSSHTARAMRIHWMAHLN